jgi:coenzyme F420-0:L-glutamate ligase/coenzyme F420-1:gamma-L-glutamate ligase
LSLEDWCGVIQILPVRGLPLVSEGLDLAREIVRAAEASGIGIMDGDVIVVSHVVVSKAEGAVYRLSELEPSLRARSLAAITGKDPRHVEAILREAERVLRVRGEIIITETRHGLVCANSGVDLSNVGEDKAAALPRDPDLSAQAIRRGIEAATGRRVAVIVADSHGRPFRRGAVNVAIGCSGLQPIWDRRGEKDLYGRVLRSKQICVADELASAAELVMGQADEGVPVAIIRGYRYTPGEEPAASIVRPRGENLFL